MPDRLATFPYRPVHLSAGGDIEEVSHMVDAVGAERADRTRLGRPRDPDVDEAIVSATLALLAEQGYARLTMDRVALKAGVAKTSLYRRWPSKESLVLDAIRHGRAGEQPTVPDTGSLRRDMLAFLRALVRYRRTRFEAVAAVASEVLANAELADAFRRHVVGDLTSGFHVIIERAVSRGELPSSTDVELVAALPLALVRHHRLLTGDVADESLAKRIVDEFFTPGHQRGRPARLR